MVRFPELMVLAILALMFFGPKRLPEAAKGLAKSIRGFRQALDGQDEREQE